VSALRNVTVSAKHLEVMVSACTPEQFAIIREFFEGRGSRITERRHGEVYRLWCDPPTAAQKAHGRPRLVVSFPEEAA
jgi:hypothetical protein